MSHDDASFAAWWQSLRSSGQDQSDVIHEAYQQLENAGLISKVTVHQFRCRRCGPVCTVIRIGDTTIARTNDFKFSPGANAARSVASARAKNTLDGNKHWPGHTFDVEERASCGEEYGGMDATCRHGIRAVRAADVLKIVEGVRPGHPGKPTLF